MQHVGATLREFQQIATEVAPTEIERSLRLCGKYRFFNLDPFVCKRYELIPRIYSRFTAVRQDCFAFARVDSGFAPFPTVKAPVYLVTLFLSDSLENAASAG